MHLSVCVRQYCSGVQFEYTHSPGELSWNAAVRRRGKTISLALDVISMSAYQRRLPASSSAGALSLLPQPAGLGFIECWVRHEQIPYELLLRLLLPLVATVVDRACS